MRSDGGKDRGRQSEVEEAVPGLVASFNLEQLFVQVLEGFLLRVRALDVGVNGPELIYLGCIAFFHLVRREGGRRGREGGREGGWEGGREGGRRGREGGREGGWEGGREGGKEGGRERGREGGREGEAGERVAIHDHKL